jgi:hypothetical protein
MRIRRASALTITAVCTDNEIREATREIVSWSLTADELVEEQWAWYVANQAKHALVRCLSLSGGWFTDKTTANLSVGIRDAYYHGLAGAVPTGPRELGYAMDSGPYDRERQPST